ncbi:Hint domain-containing protein [Palleronia rufa]|uniref:Hint domain-containing protein n=1 Tax=Palleronia rufa TaxID=1530186 RepID=UPI000690441C|nr:Hint domain-containing protein [Palleronia rufa]
MPTTFNVFSLGQGKAIDRNEGNTVAERADRLVGNTYGSRTNPLFRNIAEFSPGSTGFSGGSASDAYDQDNNSLNNSPRGEYFRLNGGPNRVFDAVAVYNATLTYTDGTTAPITAVVFQDTGSNLYLAPERANNSDQTALEAKPLQSVRLNSLNDNDFTGLFGNRPAGNFAVCFTRGTRLLTPGGYVAIEALVPGDMVTTADNGIQPILWIGRTSLTATELADAPNFRPVRLRRGHHGLMRDVLVSPQHCVAVGDSFVRARHLADIAGAGARVARGMGRVEYIHLLCDRHQVLIAEGMRTESFYPGPFALAALGADARAELCIAAPELGRGPVARQAVARCFGPPARPILTRAELRSVNRLEELAEIA